MAHQPRPPPPSLSHSCAPRGRSCFAVRGSQQPQLLHVLAARSSQSFLACCAPGSVACPCSAPSLASSGSCACEPHCCFTAAAIAGAQSVRHLSLCCASWASAARCAEPGGPASRRRGHGSAASIWCRCGLACLGHLEPSLDHAAPLSPAASPGLGAPPTVAELAASSSCRLRPLQRSLPLHSCPALQTPLRFAGSERGR